MGAEDIIKHQFPPGTSGNPEGKKPGTLNLTTVLRQYMEQEIEVTDPITKVTGKKKIKDIISLKLIANAIKGEERSIKLVFERLEGKPAQDVNLNATVTKMDKIKRNGKTLEFNVGTPDTPGSTSEAAPDSR